MLSPPLGAELLACDDLGRGAGGGRPEPDSFDGPDLFDGLAPRMQSQIEESPVDGHEERLTAECMQGADGAFGSHVNVGPQGIESADLEHGEVEGAELLSDLLKAGPLTGIGSVVQTVARAGQCERGPERFKAIEEAAAGEVPGGQSRYAYRAYLRTVHPVQFEAVCGGRGEPLPQPRG